MNKLKTLFVERNSELRTEVSTHLKDKYHFRKINTLLDI